VNLPTSSLSTRSRWAVYLELIRWNRPVGTLLLLWPALCALWWAAGGFPGWHLLTVFTLGTLLMRSAGCAVNDVADRNFDRHVKRTAMRPVTCGEISVKQALAVAIVLSLLAFGLVLSTNGATVLWSFGALTVTILYPFTKRFFAMPQAVLGVAFSMGIPMAFTAVQGGVPSWVLLLWLGNLAWVLAYDTEYAMVDREDDLGIGIHTSALTLGRWDVAGVMAFYGLALLLWGWAGWLQQQGFWYALGWLGALTQVIYHYRLIRNRSREGCFRAFQLNHWIGASLWLGLMLDYL
jgi:4-hydroxybenzoate polyprenyltransferase